MFKLCALNNSALENDKHDDSSPFWEVLEASAVKIHQDGISYLANNKLLEAKECFIQVLENPFINKASAEYEDQNAGSTQEKALKYSSLKNVGGICMKQKNYEEACKYYVQAVNLDSSEVLIWQKLGIAAIRSRKSELAMAALQEGLKINPNHWPCLDQLLSVLFLLGLHEDCLGLCIKLLNRDPNYVKALAFKDRIFKDQPHIIGFIKIFYLQSDILFRDTPYDSVKGDQFISNCLEFRPKPKERKLDVPIPGRNICNSLKNLTWNDLGLAFIKIYDDVIEKEAIAFVSKVDLEGSLKTCLNKKFSPEEFDETGTKKVNRTLSYDDKIIQTTPVDEENVRTDSNHATPKVRRKTIEVYDHDRTEANPTIIPDASAILVTARSDVNSILKVQSPRATPDEMNKSPSGISQPEYIERSSNPIDRISKSKEDVEVRRTEVDEGTAYFDDESLKTEESKFSEKELFDSADHKPTEKGDPLVLECQPSSLSESKSVSDIHTTDIDDLTMVIEGNQTNTETKREFVDKVTENLNDDKSEEVIDAKLSIVSDGVKSLVNCDPKSSREISTSINVHADTKSPMETDTSLNTHPDAKSLDKPDANSLIAIPDTEDIDPLAFHVDLKETAVRNDPTEDGFQPATMEVSEMHGSPRMAASISDLNLDNHGVASFVQEIGQFFSDHEMNFIVADNQVGITTSDGERNSASDPERPQEIDSCSKDSENSSDATSGLKVDHSKVIHKRKKGEVSDPEEPEKEPMTTQISPIVVSGIRFSPKKSPKKTKRPKRGLERELEQLDYWGRRKAREAKRRRKTITSKLVGVFEDGEYLSINHLFRGFIPAALISSEENNKTVTPKKYKEGVGLCSSIKELGSDTSTVKRKLSDDLSCGPLSKKVKISHKDMVSSLPEDEKKYVTDLNDKDDDNAHLEWTLEEFQVTKFISQYKNSVNILDLLLLWETTLINFYGKVWPKCVASCFNDIYIRGRNHVWKSLDTSQSAKLLTKMGTLALTNFELAISLFLCARENPEDLEKTAIRKKLECESIGDDLINLSFLSDRCDLWKEDYLQFNLRLRWVQAQINLIMEKANETAIILQILLTELQLSCREGEDVCIDRCRIDVDNIVVNSSQVQYQLNVLQRSNMLEGVNEKYEAGCYDDVVLVLSATFDKSTPMVASTTTSNCPSRRDQLVLLIKALHDLKDYTGVVEWSGVCLAEALLCYNKLHSDDDQLRRSWSDKISIIINYAFESFMNSECNVNNVRSQSLAKLVACLVDVIVVQLEQNANMTHLYFGSVVPWILLHVILSGEENNHAVDNTENDLEGDNENGPIKEQTFSSTLFLITAHEELGKNGWCGLECGKLLIYTCEILIKELSRPLSQDQYTAISQALEQTTYCLYSHPQRRTKHKHLRDHGIQPVLLSWTEAVKLYKFYYPAHLPDFQSSDIPSINEDLAVFIKRFISLFPDKFNVEEETKKVEEFLEADDPTSIYNVSSFSTELEDAHYLIADYHFKNKEWDLASEYYKQDVAINVTRLESWAAMGLGKKAQLETLLNSCDVIKNLNEFFNKSQVAIRSLNRALVLDKFHYNLWVERGALLFMTHSHASRTLKQDINPLMSMELFASLERIKSNSLDKSKICFIEAIKLYEEETDASLPDERWLYYYMLGKVAEKDGSEPRQVIDHYIKAFDYLHQAGAKYPARINYNNPQENSIEALEIYFRVFAYILKYLTQKEAKPVDEEELKYFHATVVKFSTGPFVSQKENKTLKQSTTGDKSPETDGLRGFVGKVAENIVSLAIQNTFERVSNLSETRKTEPINVESLIDECLIAMKLCMTRFPHHYKSLYRIAHYYFHSIARKDVVRARNYILGCQHWIRLDYMPVNGLFHDRKIFLQTPRTCNFFNGVWRIPNDEIDRPGSFAAHMYKCICMLLEVLKELNDFYCIFEIAFSLKFSPEKDKKYLRDNERELLSEHATQVGIQVLKDKYQQIFHNSSEANFNRQQSFILEIYKAYKFMTRHLSGTDALLSKLLVDTYVNINGISAESNAFVLREAEVFCARNLSTGRQQQKPQNGSAMSPVVPGAVKRGRPPGPAKIKNLSKTDPHLFISSQVQAVQQAYKVYENFAQAQTLVTNKNVDPKIHQHHKKICDGYQKQLMQYLQIPSVSRYFSSSLQSVGSAPAKLPPPSLNPSVAKVQDTGREQLLANLAAKSQAHGVSITTSTRKDGQPVLSTPSLSITVTTVKTKPLVDTIKSTLSSFRSAPSTTSTVLHKSIVTITNITPKQDKNKELIPSSVQTTSPAKQSNSKVDSDPDITFIVPPDPLSIDDVQEANQRPENEDDIIVLD